MRTCIIVLGLVAIGPAVTPVQNIDAIFKDVLKHMSDMRDVLKAVNDKSSAERALPNLKLINEKLATLKKKEQSHIKLPPEEYRMLFDKHKAKIEAVVKALDSEKARIQKLENAKSVLNKELSLFEETSNAMVLIKEAKMSAALVQIKAIDQALQVYKHKNGSFPESLEKLSEGMNPLLKTKDLYDPWAKPYAYDPKPLRNFGKMPDVWTESPDNVKIGNWNIEK